MIALNENYFLSIAALSAIFLIFFQIHMKRRLREGEDSEEKCLHEVIVLFVVFELNTNNIKNEFPLSSPNAGFVQDM